ncbi:MAG TPA: hypothetical protein VLD67_15875 [Vicinamibacterales bacterium]|nr:hypothetical protein [Vicinamibacterales bacterium]
MRKTFDVRPRTRALMIAFGLIPALHVAAAAAPAALAAAGLAPWRLAWLSPIILFVLAPLAVRLGAIRRPLPSGQFAADSPQFLRWWFSAQWQVVFTRLPLLEELLRLVPGLYSMWLRLWGARIGSLVYWSPGVVILDRSLVRIGSRVIFGVGVRLNSHAIAPDPQGTATLHVGPVTIGDDVLVGGYSLLLPGCVVAAGQVTPPFRSIHAFTRYERGGKASGARDAADGTDA